jgi:predicted DNA-binding transcriptional regulator AlpA
VIAPDHLPHFGAHRPSVRQRREEGLNDGEQLEHIGCRTQSLWTAPPAANGNSPKLVDAQELWDIDDVAAYLGVTKQTIYSWRTTGYGPAGFRVGKHLRWRAATVIAWTVGLEEAQ